MHKPTFRRRTLFASAALLTGLLAAALPASADTFSVQYFGAVTGSPDFYNGGAPLGVSNNYVTSKLGPDGLPVFNPGYTASGTVLPPNSAYLNGSGELLYWTAGAGPLGTPIVSLGTGTLSLSATPITMYPPGYTDDFTYEETAILTGYFTVPAHTTDLVNFTLGADDTGFAYVDGNLVESLGGVHADTPAISSSFSYGAGTHEIQIFYADRATSNAFLSFTDNGDFTITPGNPTNPSVPEPSTLLLFGTGLLGVASAARRRFSRS